MLHHSEMHAVQGQTGSTKPWASLKLCFHHGLKVEFSRAKVQREPERDPSTSVLSHGSSRGWPRWRGVDTAHVPVEPRSCSAHWHSPTSSSQTGCHIPDLLQLHSRNQPLGLLGIHSLTNHQPRSWSCPTWTLRAVLSRGAEPPESGLINTSSSFTSNTFFPHTHLRLCLCVCCFSQLTPSVFYSSPSVLICHSFRSLTSQLTLHSCRYYKGWKNKQEKKKKPLQITPTDAKSITMEGLNGHMVANRKKCCSINWLVIKLKRASDKGKYKHQC